MSRTWIDIGKNTIINVAMANQISLRGDQVIIEGSEMWESISFDSDSAALEYFEALSYKLLMEN